MGKILTLATAGLKPDQLADTSHEKYPRVDYLELQKLADIDIVNYEAYRNTRVGEIMRKFETSLRSDLYLMLLGLLRRHSYRAIFAMSERVGIPISLTNAFLPGRKPLVAMFTSWSDRQERTIVRYGLFKHMDVIIVKCNSLRDHFIQLGAPEDRIVLIPFAVDECFFSPSEDTPSDPRYIVSVGETRHRDYDTLIEAVDGLDVRLTILASGSWYAREKNTQAGDESRLPDNVEMSGRLSLNDLRAVYARAQFVVLPVYDLVYSAGATAALEAMGMGKAIIATRSRGLMDYVTDGETGILVDEGDSLAMREAIQYLLERPDEAIRMGHNARQRVERELTLDTYVQNIVQVLNAYTQNPS